MPYRKAHAYLYHSDIIRNQINRSHRMELKTLLIIRIIILIYLTVIMTQTIVSEIDFMDTFIYLTLWGACITYAYFIFAVIENVSYL